ncbi:MAG: hypothetical protein J0I01_15110 [Stenotrophomonas nitritireducens]|uniref:Uncharacterized protein n=1 Tax=Stenotrophomonas nitritireducens TaxID=83617 RepID=A0A9D8Q1J3_9GAMM|nr:hypothetical protein [Stenotrophomonas nitritireducens]MBN8793552.1 hypothetical protein [Stenotrophomonas nitritireducens]MBN8799736.1 hypothetical protein [Stenotrophomonas nitritireducens]
MYSLPTGDTRIRAMPVKRFMEDDAPLFLISQKAGHVDLNLNTVDTAIHFDHW